jgi:8-oxo-dGTP pyrophosphatase MutT (NUDIX family)
MSTDILFPPRKIFNRDTINENKIVNSLADITQTYENSISACGCLFYKIVDNVVQLLLIKYTDPNWQRLDDFGGKIDLDDTSVFNAMMREVSEETNGVITGEYLTSAINGDTKTFYNRKSKYYIWLVQVDDTFFPDTSIFGNNEIYDNIERTVQWYNFNEIKDSLAYRILHNDELIQYLKTV